MTTYSAAVLTVSDTAAKDASRDSSGPVVRDLLSADFDVIDHNIVPDVTEAIASIICKWADDQHINVIVTTGGTGLSPRDVTPEAIESLLTRPLPGLTQLLLSQTLAITSLAALSRPVIGLRHTTLIIALPGSPKACRECIDALKPVLTHALDIIHQRQVNHHPHHPIHGHACSSKGNRASVALDTPVAHRHRTSPYPMTSVNDALECIRTQVKKVDLGTLMVRVDEHLIGCVLAKDVVATSPVPAFRASIVDGYAVQANLGPGVYPVASHVATAGAVDKIPQLSSGQIARVTTGGVVPDGATAVVMVEDTKVISATHDGQIESTVEIRATVKEGENIRAIGSDCAEGTVVVPKGRRVSAVGGELAAIVSVGIRTVSVMARPRVGVLSTGNEVRSLSSTEPLKMGQVWDANRPALIAALRASPYCAEVVDLGIVRDSPDELQTHLRDALAKVDVMITTGGVSMGEADLVKPMLEEVFGATIHFGRVHMKPGKPTTFATVPHKGHPRLVFALPGNPVSAMVTSQLFVLPALAQLSGHGTVAHHPVHVELQNTVALDPRPEYHRVLVWEKKGLLLARSTDHCQQSSRILNMVRANGLVVLPGRSEAKTTLHRGERVPCLLIGPLL